jgi:hypothetical protein
MALAAQVGLTPAQVQALWNLASQVLPTEEETAQEDMRSGMGQSPGLGALVDLLNIGGERNQGDLFKRKIIEAMARGLGLDPQRTEVLVERLFELLGKMPQRRRRRTTGRATKAGTSKSDSSTEARTDKSGSSAKAGTGKSSSAIKAGSTSGRSTKAGTSRSGSSAKAGTGKSGRSTKAGTGKSSSSTKAETGKSGSSTKAGTGKSGSSAKAGTGKSGSATKAGTSRSSAGRHESEASE